MDESTRASWSGSTVSGDAGGAAPRSARPTVGVVLERIGYGSLALLIVLTVFLADVAISRHFDGLDTAIEEGMSVPSGTTLPTIGVSEPLERLLRQGSTVPVFVLLVMLGGAIELVRLARLRGARPHAVLAYVTVAALILAPWLSASGWLGHRPMHVEGIYWVLIAVAASGVWLVLVTVFRGDPANTFRDVGATMVVIVYVGLLGSFATQLRCSQDIPAQEGAWLLLILVFVTKCSDIGAYFVGSAIGRHKLAPTISPGKSIEGTLGGLATSALAATVIAFSGVSESFRLANGIGSGFSAAWQPAAFGIIVAISAQAGDLFESCFKRDAGSKDSGQIFPRFGGILDLLDSLLPTLAVGWFLLTTVWRIG